MRAPGDAGCMPATAERVLEMLGWFDDASQSEPSHDPAHDGPCMVCEEPLSTPVKTVSMMWQDGAERSYFYRAHAGCIDAPEKSQRADDKAWGLIKAANLESNHSA